MALSLEWVAAQNDPLREKCETVHWWLVMSLLGQTKEPRYLLGLCRII